MILNHVLVRTNDLKAMEKFLTQAIGLKKGFRPPFPFPGDWYYAGEVANIHVVEGNVSKSVDAEDPEKEKQVGQGYKELIKNLRSKNETKTIDHVAFMGDNYEQLISRLKNTNTKYYEANVPLTKQRQVFAFGPDEIKIQIIFKLNE